MEKKCENCQVWNLDSPICECCGDFDRHIKDGSWYQEKIKALQAELEAAKSLIDGCESVIQLFAPKTPSQITWKKEWLEKAKELLKGR